MDSLHLLGVVAATDVHSWAGEVVSGDGLEGVVLLPSIEFRDGSRVNALEIGKTANDCHDPVGIRIRQRLQQDYVDHRKDGGVGANTQRQRRDGDSRETGTLAQDAKGVSQVSEQVLHALDYASGCRIVPSFFPDDTAIA